MQGGVAAPRRSLCTHQLRQSSDSSGNKLPESVGARRTARACRSIKNPQLIRMVFSEIKPQIEQLDPADRLKAFAFLKHLLRANDPAYQAEISRRHTDIDAGKGITLSEAKRRLGEV